MTLTALLLLLWVQDDPTRQVERLRSDRVEERSEAEKALRTLGEAAVPALERGARDPDPELASRAATLLRILVLNREMPAALKTKHPELADRLARGDDSLWTDAFLEHVWTWDRDGLDFLVARALLGRKKAENGAAVLMHLQRLQLASAVPGLVRIVHEGDDRDRKAALNLLRGYGYEWRASPIDVLAGVVPEGDAGAEPLAPVRRAAASCFPEIRAMVEHPLPEVRFQGAILLGRFGSRESVPALLKLIEKDTVEIRRASVEALIFLKAPEALPFVLENLKSPDAGVRARSIEAIERLAAKERARDVAGLMSDSSPMVAGQALVTLSRMGAAEFRPAVSAYLESPSSAVRYYAILALGFYGAKDLAGAIVGRLNDDDVEVRWAAIVTLGALGAKEAVPDLEKLLQAPLEKTRLLARKSLDRIGKK